MMEESDWHCITADHVLERFIAAFESQKSSRSKCLEMLTRAPIMEYDARSLSHGLFCSIVYEGVEGVNLTGGLRIICCSKVLSPLLPMLHSTHGRPSNSVLVPQT